MASGQILSIEEQEIAGAKLELFVITFIKDKMTLRVPTAKIASVGMRKLAEPPLVRRALETLKGRARIKRTMWSRRAQEYEAKINSGDIVAIAEVVRDLFRSETQPEQSYSERQLYEAALDRLSREISAVQRVTETEAVKEIEAALAKGPRRGRPSPPARKTRRSRTRPRKRGHRPQANSPAQPSRSPAAMPGFLLGAGVTIATRLAFCRSSRAPTCAGAGMRAPIAPIVGASGNRPAHPGGRHGRALRAHQKDAN